MESRKADIQPRRMFSLDLLRGIAILLVIGRHWPRSEDAISMALASIGWIGVDLFFVLSGFLISGILVDEYNKTGDINLRRFWIRRGMKIWPAYFVVFGGVMALRLANGGADGEEAFSRAIGEWKASVPNLLLVQNYLHGFWWPHTWSLAVEEHFYIVLPILLVGIASFRSAHGLSLLPVAAGVVFASCLLLRLYLASEGVDRKVLYQATHLRIDSLACGVLLGYLFKQKRFAFASSAPMPVAAGVGIVAAIVIPLLRPIETSMFTNTVGFTMLYVVFGVVVVFAAARPDFGANNILARAVAYVGCYSYTIYLFHGAMTLSPGYKTLMTALGSTGGVWAQRGSFFVASIIGGVILARVIEKPALALRDRICPSANRLSVEASITAPTSTRSAWMAESCRSR